MSKPLTTVGGKPLLLGGRLLMADVATVLASLTDYPGRAVFPRRGTSSTLTVNVAYSGAAPASLEGRVVDFTNGATVVKDWTPLANLQATGGIASGQLANVTQGWWYRLQVRNPASPTAVLSGTVQFGIGPAIGTIGQSNMVGFTRERFTAFPISDQRVESWEGGAFKRVGQINAGLPPGALYGTDYFTQPVREGGEIGDGLIFFTNALSAALNLPILIVDRAENATGIDLWIPGGRCWAAFAQAIAEVGGDLEMVLFYQGESNAYNTTGAAMKQYWSQMQAEFYRITGRDATNSHFGLVSLGPGAYNGSQPGQFGAMRAAQVEYSTSTAGAFYAGAAHDTQTVDGVHLSPTDQGRMGKRWQRSVLNRLGNGVSGAGPYVVSASYSNGSGIATLTLAHAGGTALIDGAGGAGASLTGFEFKNAGGGVLSITATAISSPTTLQFTVSGVPATVSYAMMDSPHNTGGSSSAAVVPASVVYDNAAPGFPIRPFAAIPVTGG